MLSSIEHLAILEQLPLAQAGQLLLVTGITFAVITLIFSSFRFQKIISLSGGELNTVQDFNNFFSIQITRYISRISRSGFGLIIFQIQTDSSDHQAAQHCLFTKLQESSRGTLDKICIFREDCVAILLDTEAEKIASVAGRITRDCVQNLAALPGVTAIKAGASSFPDHGPTSKALIDSALRALDAAVFSSPLPLSIAEIEHQESSVPPPEGAAQDELPRKETKTSSIDALTGVLSSTVVGSYMRKYLSDLRYKKQAASVLCAGINRIENIIALHGEEAADIVIVGISQVLQRLTRESDLIGRYRRDDFLILAPCTLEQGMMIALRLREAVQNEVFMFQGKRIKTSISIGITAYPHHGRAFRDLFRGAYTALEIIRDWDTSSCLIYDPTLHNKKVRHEKTT